MEEILKGKENVKKILNGGGSLSAELIKDVSIFLPRAKLISAYGALFFPLLFTYCFLKLIFFWLTPSSTCCNLW